jgi:hypothetical protein
LVATVVEAASCARSGAEQTTKAANTSIDFMNTNPIIIASRTSGREAAMMHQPPGIFGQSRDGHRFAIGQSAN